MPGATEMRAVLALMVSLPSRLLGVDVFAEFSPHRFQHGNSLSTSFMLLNGVLKRVRRHGDADLAQEFNAMNTFSGRYQGRRPC
jgi:hypothetical protein